MIKLFVRRYFTGLGDSHCLGQEESSRIPRITDALWNSRAPGDPRRIKRVLQKQCQVEFLFAQFGRKPLPATNSIVNPATIVLDESIANPLISINVPHVR